MMDRQASTYYHHLYAQQAAHAQIQYHDPIVTPVGYRPLHLPLQQQQQQQHHLAAEQQLSLAGSFHNPHFRPHHQQQQQQQQQQFHQHILPLRVRQQVRMQEMAIQGQSDEEFAELQKLSNEYEPEVTGPLVSHREPSSNITTEYASADPVYQAKTAALPQKYSHYRMMRGDGRCGWRAIGFGYFEALIHLGDSNKFLEEETRLRSLSNVVNAAGFDSFIYEDFADEAFNLLREVANAMHTGNASEVLHNAFNDDMVQNYLITYFKTLTAAWMKTHAADYAPWLLDRTVDQYCDESVTTVGGEIDNVSMSGLKDVLLSPSGIALEILYLDRTEGGEVNMHRFDPVSFHGGITIGTIRLLYRPGHYDILYKIEDFPLPPAPDPTPIPTYLQFGSQTHQEHVFDIAGMDFLTQLPGMSCVNPHSAWLSGPSYGSGASDFFASTTPVQHCVQPIPAPAPAPTPAPQPQTQPQPVYVVSAVATHVVPPPNDLSQELAIRTVSHASLANTAFQHQLAGPFRPSIWQLEEGFVQATSHAPFQTTIFKNSVYNTAHFANPDFQPEEWRPDDDYVTPSSKLPRQRASG
ncbi:hypothetical protein LTS09_011318 [Friedmanniomyces endolithicus]|nr:hypothetical protein LTS09_011318 [Friedmanniomyces endolithicus]